MSVAAPQIQQPQSSSVGSGPQPAAGATDGKERKKAPKEKKSKRTTGMLRIFVHRARKLVDTELIGKQDPFIRFTLGVGSSNHKQTHTCLDQGSEPDWGGEEVLMSLTGTGNESQLVCRVLNENIMIDADIGTVTVQVKDVPRWKRARKRWYPLIRSNGSAGEVCMTIGYIPPFTIFAEQARHLHDTSLWGLQDPYLKFKIGDSVHGRTPIHGNGGRYPVWNHHPFTFNLGAIAEVLAKKAAKQRSEKKQESAPADGAPEGGEEVAVDKKARPKADPIDLNRVPVSLEVWARGPIKDKFVGRCEVALSVFKRMGNNKPAWFFLYRDGSAKPHGELCLTPAWTKSAICQSHVCVDLDKQDLSDSSDGDSDDGKIDADDEDGDSSFVEDSLVANHSAGCVYVTAHEAKDLYNTQTLGRQDPYCRMRMGLQIQRTRTATDQHTKASWGDVFTFPLTGGGEHKGRAKEREVVVQVMNSNIVVDADIGTSIQRVAELADVNVAGQKWYDLVRGSGAAGSVLLTMGFVPPLTIVVHEARSLPDVQMLGKQDPYVTVRVNKLNFRTPVHNDGGRDPKFGSEAINVNLPVMAKDCEGKAVIDWDVRFEVWNKGLISDTLISHSRMPLSALLNGPNTRSEFRWYPLDKGEGDAVQRGRGGEVMVSAEWQPWVIDWLRPIVDGYNVEYWRTRRSAQQKEDEDRKMDEERRRKEFEAEQGKLGEERKKMKEAKAKADMDATLQREAEERKKRDDEDRAARERRRDEEDRKLMDRERRDRGYYDR